MNCVMLNNGIKMPLLGFGCYLLKDPEECEKSVYNALMAGYRLIDTAASYGNEEAVGRAIRRSGIPREELFITTKLWVDDYGRESTLKACERSLNRLGLSYLDLYLMHQPFGDVFGAWRAMEKLYQEGKARAIGVSNFYPDRLTDLALRSEIKPAVNQVEINPFCQQTESVDYMKTFGVQPEAWSSLATGRCGLLENPVILEIAGRYERSAAQIILRWVTQRGIVTIPKAAKKEHMLENLESLNFDLAAADMEKIASLNEETSVYFGKLSHRDPETVKRFVGMKFDT